jgi:hypothetical protein
MEFPKKLYVWTESYENGEGVIFHASEAPADSVEEGDVELIGIYEFKQAVEVSWEKAVSMEPIPEEEVS